MHDQMMVGAFSQSTAVGKLRLELPDVPVNARVNLPRYNLEEGATVCHYYLRFASFIFYSAKCDNKYLSIQDSNTHVPVCSCVFTPQ